MPQKKEEEERETAYKEKEKYLMTSSLPFNSGRAPLPLPTLISLETDGFNFFSSFEIPLFQRKPIKLFHSLSEEISIKRL